jgi:integrase
MKGHVRKRGSSWYVKIELDRDPATGKRRQKWYSGFVTKKAAEAELAKLIHQRETGTFIEPSGLTVGQYLQHWLKEYAENRVAGKTLERYRQIVDNALTPVLGSIALPKLQPLHIESFYNDQLAHGRKTKKGRGGSLSAQTVLHYHRLLHKALAVAMRWNLIAANPTDRVEPPSVRPKEMQAVDPARAAWLIEVSASTRLYIPIMLAAFCGLRRGEILALRWQDIDLENSVLRVVRAIEETKAGVTFKEPKSRYGRRDLYIHPALKTALEQHLSKQGEYQSALAGGYDENDLVCSVEDGSIWKPSAFDSSYRALLKRRKLTGPNFHALRHANVSWQLREKVDPKTISTVAGHSRVSFTLDRYAHVMPGMKEDALQRVGDVLQRAREKLSAGRPS